MPKGARLYGLSQLYGNIAINQLERSAFEWPGQMRFAPPEVEKTLQYIRSIRRRRRTQQSPTDQNDEQVDDLLWVPRDVQDERICYLWWRCNNNNDLDMVSWDVFGQERPDYSQRV